LLIAKHLTRSLRLRWRSICFGPVWQFTFGFRLFALRGRLFHFDFLASIVIGHFVTCAARNFATYFAIRFKAAIANQRTNTDRLAFDGIERIYAGNPDVQLHARVLVEQIERPLRCRIPVAVYRSGVAADASQFGLQRAWEINHRSLIGFVSLRRQRGYFLIFGIFVGSGFCFSGSFRDLCRLGFVGGLRYCCGLRTLGFRDLCIFGPFG
jgi:hypothetical protein